MRRLGGLPVADGFFFIPVCVEAFFAADRLAFFVRMFFLAAPFVGRERSGPVFAIRPFFGGLLRTFGDLAFFGLPPDACSP